MSNLMLVSPKTKSKHSIEGKRTGLTHASKKMYGNTHGYLLTLLIFSLIYGTHPLTHSIITHLQAAAPSTV